MLPTIVVGRTCPKKCQVNHIGRKVLKALSDICTCHSNQVITMSLSSTAYTCAAVDVKIFAEFMWEGDKHYVILLDPIFVVGKQKGAGSVEFTVPSEEEMDECIPPLEQEMLKQGLPCSWSLSMNKFHRTHFVHMALMTIREFHLCARDQSYC